MCKHFNTKYTEEIISDQIVAVFIHSLFFFINYPKFQVLISPLHVVLHDFYSGKKEIR